MFLPKFYEGLIFDFAKEKETVERNKAIANKVAVTLEKALYKKYYESKGEETYKLEVRSALGFISDKRHGDLRKTLLNGGSVEMFLHDKEHFLDASAKERSEKMKRDTLDANDMDYDKKKSTRKCLI